MHLVAFWHKADIPIPKCLLLMLWTAPTLRHQSAKGWSREANHVEGEPSMGEVSTIGLDIAKSVFQLHGVDSGSAVVMRKHVSRAKVLEFFGGLSPCLVGIEACPSAHYWSREQQALGHAVKLMPPSYVKAYLKRSKNDANDAGAICEAVTRPSMRFVPIKSEQQQSGLMLHRTRQLLIRQRTMLSMQSAGIWPNSASSRPRAATAWLNCCSLLVMRRTIGFHRLRGFVSTFLLANT
jgi:hypothetical protein